MPHSPKVTMLRNQPTCVCMSHSVCEARLLTLSWSLREGGGGGAGEGGRLWRVFSVSLLIWSTHGSRQEVGSVWRLHGSNDCGLMRPGGRSSKMVAALPNTSLPDFLNRTQLQISEDLRLVDLSSFIVHAADALLPSTLSLGLRAVRGFVALLPTTTAVVQEVVAAPVPKLHSAPFCNPVGRLL